MNLNKNIFIFFRYNAISTPDGTDDFNGCYQSLSDITTNKSFYNFNII